MILSFSQFTRSLFTLSPFLPRFVYFHPTTNRPTTAKGRDKVVELISNSLPQRRNRITFVKSLEPTKKAQNAKYETWDGSPDVNVTFENRA